MSSILVFFVGICLALLENPNLRSSSLANNSSQINSNSVLVALLDLHYTELTELVEKALLLQTLEETVGKHNITIFAPKNEALDRDLDLESFTFKLFSWFESESFLATKFCFFFFFFWVCVLGSGFVVLLFLFKTHLDLNTYDFQFLIFLIQMLTWHFLMPKNIFYY